MNLNSEKFLSVWSDSFKLFGTCLKRLWFWLLLSFVFGDAVDWATSEMVRANDQYMLSGMLFTLAAILLLMVIGVILINHVAMEARRQVRTSVWAALNQNFKYVFIESTRALKPITLKLLMLVIPGVIEGIRLYFVPYVVQFDPEYPKGQVDALERSRELVRNRFWTVAGILLLTTVLSILPGFLLSRTGLPRGPAYYGLAVPMTIGLELYASLVLFCTYERLDRGWRLSREKNGNSISLQGSSRP